MGLWALQHLGVIVTYQCTLFHEVAQGIVVAFEAYLQSGILCGSRRIYSNLALSVSLGCINGPQ
jgi:hypothetical protein